MNWAGKIGESLRAGVVLALFFLNFAHVPLSAAPADAFVPLSIASICGDPIGDERNQAHAPCHACRIGSGADLPPVCAIVEPAFAVADIRYDDVVTIFTLAAPPLTAEARAPPAV